MRITVRRCARAAVPERSGVGCAAGRADRFDASIARVQVGSGTRPRSGPGEGGAVRDDTAARAQGAEAAECRARGPISRQIPRPRRKHVRKRGWRCGSWRASTTGSRYKLARSSAAGRPPAGADDKQIAGVATCSAPDAETVWGWLGGGVSRTVSSVMRRSLPDGVCGKAPRGPQDVTRAVPT